ncbi:signal peptidase I [Leucobacter luti]|uniref:Signal peptidase I n=1 Tax=Leucobacter luti TaxID=340320 RepID=A0A4Q7U334_9MICO|nr:signal peptidase I [Leucobacter luti]MBL3699141.1 signal peptidase I [Leucobacter luti]RZT66642.1 signal peptidase [Leucobacter luti]
MSVRRQVRRLTSRGAVKSSWFESPWRIAGRAVSSALVLAVIILLLAIVAVPRILGGDSFTVLSGSMEPTFAPGDVVVAKGISEAEVCTDVSVGTIVTFFPKPNDPTLITHRVVGKTIGTFDDGTSCRLITQGDANSSVDEPISPAQVRGVFMYGIPKLGWARQWVSENTMLVVGIAAAALVIAGLWSSFKRPRTTVMTVPRPAGPSTPAGGAAPAHGAARRADAQVPGRDHALVERELELRERELELRERELAFAMQRAPQQDAAEPSFDTELLTPERFLGTADEDQSSELPATKRIEA